jgi:dual specificity protein kinase YAK1
MQQQQHQQNYPTPIQAQSQPQMRPPPFSPAYDPPPSAGHRARMPSQGQWHPMGPPQGTAMYNQPRIPSSSMATSSSHGVLRTQPPPTMSINTNPPPNSYYPASRNRSNTINQMDVIPPALARLTHMSMPDPSGHRNLTPVLNRGDDPYREWERRQAGGGGGGGHSKNSSMHQTSYPQLEYLQEQAELAAMGGSWMMPGQYTSGGGQQQQQGGQGHRSRPSGSSTYQMQPHIGVSPTSPGMGYHARQPSEYDLPLPNSAGPSSSGASRPYLPTFPPPAATHSSSTPNFDVFDTSRGMLYTPLQPNQAYGHPGQPHGYGGVGGGSGGNHQSRASFSGPFGIPNPFGQQQGQGQGGQQSPRNQRRSQQYNV